MKTNKISYSMSIIKKYAFYFSFSQIFIFIDKNYFWYCEKRKVIQTRAHNIYYSNLIIDNVFQKALNLQDVFIYALSNINSNINHVLLQNINSMLFFHLRKKTNDFNEFSSYRKSDVWFGKNKLKGENPKNIHTTIDYILKKYNNKTVHSESEICSLYCDLIRVHPFIDGNGRTFKTILIKEYLRNHFDFFIIKKTDDENFNNYCNTDDINHLINFIRKLQDNWKLNNKELIR